MCKGANKERKYILAFGKFLYIKKIKTKQLKTKKKKCLAKWLQFHLFLLLFCCFLDLFFFFFFFFLFFFSFFFCCCFFPSVHQRKSRKGKISGNKRQIDVDSFRYWAPFSLFSIFSTETLIWRWVEKLAEALRKKMFKWIATRKTFEGDFKKMEEWMKEQMKSRNEEIMEEKKKSN